MALPDLHLPGIPLEHIDSIPDHHQIGRGLQVSRYAVAASEDKFEAATHKLTGIDPSVEVHHCLVDAGLGYKLSRIEIVDHRRLIRATETDQARLMMQQGRTKAYLHRLVSTVAGLSSPLDVTADLSTVYMQPVTRVREKRRSTEVTGYLLQAALMGETAARIRDERSAALAILGLRGPRHIPAIPLAYIKAGGDNNRRQERIVRAVQQRRLGRVSIHLTSARVIPIGLSDEFWTR